MSKRNKKYYNDEETKGVSKEDMKVLADHIEDYLTVLEDIFIIPDYLRRSKKQIEEAMDTTRKLIKKLRDGDRSVFKNTDDWELI